MTRLAVVEVGQLLQVVWVSVSASLIVIVAFSFAVREVGRSTEARRDGRGGAAAVHAGLAAILLVAFVAFVAYGVITMLQK